MSNSEGMFEAQTRWYAALDAVVDQITDALESSPIGVNYETGGHVAVAHWQSDDANLLVSVLLSDSLDGCEFQTSQMLPTESVGTLDEVVTLWQEVDGGEAAPRAAVVLAKIVTMCAKSDTPIENFRDSKPQDLDDMCRDLKITRWEALAAQRVLVAAL